VRSILGHGAQTPVYLCPPGRAASENDGIGATPCFEIDPARIDILR
jgi:hypothetical protein